MSECAKWMTLKVCPKCGSTEFHLDEEIAVANTYTASNGVITFDGTVEAGDIIKVTCVCSKCQHRWHPHRNGIFVECSEEGGAE